MEVNKQLREQYLTMVEHRVQHLPKLLDDKNIAKIALAMLYLGEGTKRSSGKITFGNSDASIIKLFLKLLRRCYNIDEKKFRCTLQCRADQEVPTLEDFWSETTGIPRSQFYTAQIDPRTVNRPSKRVEYKGVCRIDYLSADLFVEIMKLNEIIAGP
ncbi:MAG: hypothetical protein Q8P82_02760 [bacterium]|nr:hypothetical protein [bacterium]